MRCGSVFIISMVLLSSLLVHEAHSTVIEAGLFAAKALAAKGLLIGASAIAAKKAALGIGATVLAAKAPIVHDSGVECVGASLIRRIAHASVPRLEAEPVVEVVNVPRIYVPPPPPPPVPSPIPRILANRIVTLGRVAGETITATAGAVVGGVLDALVRRRLPSPALRVVHLPPVVPPPQFIEYPLVRRIDC